MRKRIFAVSSLLLVIALLFSALIIFNATAEDEKTYKKSDVFTPISGVLEDGIQDDFAFPEAYVTSRGTNMKDDAFPVQRSESGVVVYARSSVMEFEYENAINLRSFTKNDTIVELFPYIGSVGDIGNYAKASHVTITLTDTEDNQNSVAIHYEEQGSNRAIYARALYDGLDMSYDVNGNPKVRNGEYGIYAYNGTTFAHRDVTSKEQPLFGKGEISPFIMSLDYTEKCVYLKCTTKTGAVFTDRSVLDLDDEGQVGIGRAWKGFTNDTAYLSIKVEFEEAITTSKKGGVVVKSVAGNNLDGTLTADTDFPEPEILTLYDEYGEVLPDGCVGLDYAIPQIYASDWYFGQTDDQDILVTINKKVGDSYSSQVTTFNNGGIFVPEEAGEYQVLYTAKNEKHQAQLIRYFKVNAEQTPIYISLATAPQKDVYFRHYFTVPEVVINGGSGNLKVTETLRYNGAQIELGEDRRVYIDKSGNVSLTVQAAGYVGSPVTKSFTFGIDDNVMLIVENVPSAILGGNGEALVLPEAKAYDAKTNAALDVTITADGEDVTQTRILSTAKTSGEVTVVYSAGGKSETYYLQVIDATVEASPISYSKKLGSVSLAEGDDGVEISPKKDGDGIKWVYPVVTGFASKPMTVKLKNNPQKTNFEYVDITLTDYANLQKSVFIRISKNHGAPNSSLIRINGVGEAIQLNVGFEDENILEVYVSNNALYTYAGQLLYDFSSKYDAKLSYFSITFGGVSGDAGIYLMQLSNQSMIVTKNGFKEVIPVILFDKPLPASQICSKGSTVKVPSATCYDLTSSYSEIKLLVRDEDNEKVLETSDLANGVSFKADKLGFYSMVFTVTDGNGKSGRLIYSVQVADRVNPVLTVSKTIKSVLEAGTTVAIPGASAKDDLDGSCKVDIFVRELATYKIYKVKGGQQFSFIRTGKYEIVYNTEDLSGNYTFYSYIVEVK